MYFLFENNYQPQFHLADSVNINMVHLKNVNIFEKMETYTYFD